MINIGGPLRDELLSKSCDTFRFSDRPITFDCDYILFENHEYKIFVKAGRAVAWVESTEGSFEFDTKIEFKCFWFNGALEHGGYLYVLVNSEDPIEWYFFVYRIGTFEFMHSFIIPRLNDTKVLRDPKWGIGKNTDTTIPSPLIVCRDAPMLFGHINDEYFRTLQPNQETGFMELAHSDRPMDFESYTYRGARTWKSIPNGFGVMYKGKIESVFTIAHDVSVCLTVDRWVPWVYLYNTSFMVVAEYIPPRWTPEDHVLFPVQARDSIRTLMTIGFYTNEDKNDTDIPKIFRTMPMEMMHLLFEWVAYVDCETLKHEELNDVLARM